MMKPISLIVLLLTLSAFGVNSLQSELNICPPNGEIVAPHPTSCSKYISCAHGHGKVFKCQNGKIFNHVMGICADRNGTTCDLCKFNTKPLLLLPFEGNSSKYIICHGVNSTVRECPDQSNFNPTLGMCDEHESHEWGHNSRSDEAVSTTIECRNDDKVEFLPSIDSCEEYFVCANGTPTPHNCSDDLIYNIEANRCTTTGRCLLDYVPTCVASGTYLPHLFECRHYFYCESDEPEALLQACKLGQLFDRSKLRCVPENEALCSDPPNSDDDLEDWPNQ